MTKKHFIRAAEIIRTIQKDCDREIVARNFAELFAEFNDRFDHDRFMEACKPKLNEGR